VTPTTFAVVTTRLAPRSPRRHRVAAVLAVWGAAAAMVLSTTSCLQPYVAPPPTPVDSAVAREDFAKVLTSYWREMIPRRPRFAAAVGQRVDAILSPTLATSDDERTRFVSRRLTQALERVDAEALSPRDYASLQTLRWELDLQAEGASIGMPDFSIVSSSESSLREAIEILLDHPFTSAGDLDRYLFLVDGLALWLSDAIGVLQTWQEQGVTANREAVEDFTRWLRTFRGLVTNDALQVAPSRLVSIDTGLVVAFRVQEAEGLRERLVPALDSLVSWLGGYRTAATERPGLWQYPGGKEYYRYLLRRRLGLEVEPEEAHQAALSQLRRVDSLLRIIQPRLSRTGPLRLDSLRALPSVAPRSTPEVVTALSARLRAVADTLRTRVRGMPDSLPTVRVATPMESLLYPDGVVRPPEFLYSATELAVTPWWGTTTAQLEGPGRAFAWGWPGRSLAAAVSYAGGVLNPVVLLHASRTTSAGWAEYAASMAGELGFYADPLATWGQLMHEGLNAAWLIVDTGVHYFGWSRAQAMATLRPFSTATTAELDSMFVARVIQSPGSAGAAAMGARELAAMRTWMQRLLGREFDEALWHQELLTLGPVPLPVLAAHLEWWGWEAQQRAVKRAAAEEQARKARRR
jgi:uncharacterized protein (DUF885 family)